MATGWRDQPRARSTNGSGAPALADDRGRMRTKYVHIHTANSADGRSVSENSYLDILALRRHGRMPTDSRPQTHRGSNITVRPPWLVYDGFSIHASRHHGGWRRGISSPPDETCTWMYYIYSSVRHWEEEVSHRLALATPSASQAGGARRCICYSRGSPRGYPEYQFKL